VRAPATPPRRAAPRASGRFSRLRSAALALLVVAGGEACRPDLTGTEVPEGVRFLELTGEWAYTASDVHRAGSSTEAGCQISGVVLQLTKVKDAGAFTGRSSGGALACSGELGFLSGPLVSYPIGNGYTFNQFVSFDFGSPDWRHDGLVVSTDSVNIDSMSGKFTLKTEGVVFEGNFRAVRRGGS
jgi:hypothetical protein